MVCFALLSIISYFTYDKFTTPYSLPKIQNVDPEKYDIDWSQEKKVSSLSNSSSESKTYHDTLKLLKTDNAKAVEQLKKLIKKHPDNLVYSNTLRIAMQKEEYGAKFVAFTETIKNQTPQLQLQKALAYIDQLQNQQLGTASLGQLSLSSIQVLNQVIEENPHEWSAHYARGLNNLYWPVGLKRIDKAVQDLGFCLAVLKQQNIKDNPVVPLTYMAYGDALVKSGEIEKGVSVWKEGEKLIPDHKGLKERVVGGEKKAKQIVAKDRGIDHFQRPEPTLTDLSILWK